MARKLEEIAAEVLELTQESRAALAKQLLASLPEPSAHETQERWVAEAARRYQDLLAGRAKTVPSEEVFAKLEAGYKK